MANDRYEIKTIADILALPEDKRERCCIDLLALGRLNDGFQTDGESWLKVCTDIFVWVDDGHTGTVSGFTLNNETATFDAPVVV